MISVGHRSHAFHINAFMSQEGGPAIPQGGCESRQPPSGPAQHGSRGRLSQAGDNFVNRQGGYFCEQVLASAGES